MHLMDLLLIIITGALFLRVWLPWGEPVCGNLVRRERLALLGRLRMHGPLAALIPALAILLLALGRVRVESVLGVIALLALLLALPARYTVTSRGIRFAWTPFRRWTEFGGVARRPGGVRLQGVAGARPLTVWLSGGRDDDEFVLLLRQLVRGSYKGQLGPEAGAPMPNGAPGAAPGTIGIVGVGGS
jgi:hypothetical protein